MRGLVAVSWLITFAGLGGSMVLGRKGDEKSDRVESPLAPSVERLNGLEREFWEQAEQFLDHTIKFVRSHSRSPKDGVSYGFHKVLSFLLDLKGGVDGEKDGIRLSEKFWMDIYKSLFMMWESLPHEPLREQALLNWAHTVDTVGHTYSPDLAGKIRTGAVSQKDYPEVVQLIGFLLPRIYQLQEFVRHVLSNEFPHARKSDLHFLKNFNPVLLALPALLGNDLGESPFQATGTFIFFALAVSWLAVFPFVFLLGGVIMRVFIQFLNRNRILFEIRSFNWLSGKGFRPGIWPLSLFNLFHFVPLLQWEGEKGMGLRPEGYQPPILEKLDPRNAYFLEVLQAAFARAGLDPNRAVSYTMTFDSWRHNPGDRKDMISLFVGMGLSFHEAFNIAYQFKFPRPSSTSNRRIKIEYFGERDPWGARLFDGQGVFPPVYIFPGWASILMDIGGTVHPFALEPTQSHVPTTMHVISQMPVPSSVRDVFLRAWKEHAVVLAAEILDQHKGEALKILYHEFCHIVFNQKESSLKEKIIDSLESQRGKNNKLNAVFDLVEREGYKERQISREVLARLMSGTDRSGALPTDEFFSGVLPSGMGQELREDAEKVMPDLDLFCSVWDAISEVLPQSPFIPFLGPSQVVSSKTNPELKPVFERLKGRLPTFMMVGYPPLVNIEDIRPLLEEGKIHLFIWERPEGPRFFITGLPPMNLKEADPVNGIIIDTRELFPPSRKLGTASKKGGKDFSGQEKPQSSKKAGEDLDPKRLNENPGMLDAFFLGEIPPLKKMVFEEPNVLAPVATSFNKQGFSVDPGQVDGLMDEFDFSQSFDGNRTVVKKRLKSRQKKLEKLFAAVFRELNRRGLTKERFASKFLDYEEDITLAQRDLRRTKIAFHILETIAYSKSDLKQFWFHFENFVILVSGPSPDTGICWETVSAFLKPFKQTLWEVPIRADWVPLGHDSEHPDHVLLLVGGLVDTEEWIAADFASGQFTGYPKIFLGPLEPYAENLWAFIQKGRPDHARISGMVSQFFGELCATLAGAFGLPVELPAGLASLNETPLSPSGYGARGPKNPNEKEPAPKKTLKEEILEAVKGLKTEDEIRDSIREKIRKDINWELKLTPEEGIEILKALLNPELVKVLLSKGKGTSSYKRILNNAFSDMGFMIQTLVRLKIMESRIDEIADLVEKFMLETMESSADPVVDIAVYDVVGPLFSKGLRHVESEARVSKEILSNFKIQDSIFRGFEKVSDEKTMHLFTDLFIDLLGFMLNKNEDGKWDGKIRTWAPTISLQLKKFFNARYYLNNYYNGLTLARLFAANPTFFNDPGLLALIVKESLEKIKGVNKGRDDFGEDHWHNLQALAEALEVQGHSIAIDIYSPFVGFEQDLQDFAVWAEFAYAEDDPQIGREYKNLMDRFISRVRLASQNSSEANIRPGGKWLWLRWLFVDKWGVSEKVYDFGLGPLLENGLVGLIFKFIVAPSALAPLLLGIYPDLNVWAWFLFFCLHGLNFFVRNGRERAPPNLIAAGIIGGICWYFGFLPLSIPALYVHISVNIFLPVGGGVIARVFKSPASLALLKRLYSSTSSIAQRFRFSHSLRKAAQDLVAMAALSAELPNANAGQVIEKFYDGRSLKLEVQSIDPRFKTTSIPLGNWAKIIQDVRFPEILRQHVSKELSGGTASFEQAKNLVETLAGFGLPKVALDKLNFDLAIRIRNENDVEKAKKLAEKTPLAQSIILLLDPALMTGHHDKEFYQGAVLSWKSSIPVGVHVYQSHLFSGNTILLKNLPTSLPSEFANRKKKLSNLLFVSFDSLGVDTTGVGTHSELRLVKVMVFDEMLRGVLLTLDKYLALQESIRRVSEALLISRQT